MNRLFFLFCAVILVPVIGCSGGLKVEYVEGTIKHDGSPLAGATVTFVPKTDGEGMIASGTTDSNGVYKLTVIQGGALDKGTTPGEYLVSVVKKTEDPIRMAPPPDSYPDSDKIPIYGYVFPKKYTNATTSGFIATIKPGKNLNIDFELTGPGDVTLKQN